MVSQAAVASGNLLQYAIKARKTFHLLEFESYSIVRNMEVRELRELIE
jgi:hypothetical protein